MISLRFLVTTLIIIINFILQTTIFSYIEFWGVRPNASIILIVSFAIFRYDGEGAIIGFFTGLLQDIIFGSVIGVHAFLGMTIGYFCGKPFKDFYAENYLLPLFLVFVSTLFYEFAYYIITFFFRGKLDMFFYLKRIILPSIIYTALLSIPAYRFFYAINKKIEKFEKPKRKLF